MDFISLLNDTITALQDQHVAVAPSTSAVSRKPRGTVFLHPWIHMILPSLLKNGTLFLSFILH